MPNLGDLEVELVPCSALKTYRRNVHTHSRKQIRQIANSIKLFGWTNPILVDQSGLIIAGAGRHAAAALLGLERIPVIRIEGLTRAQLRAYRLADNKLADSAGWDRQLLALELGELMEMDRDFEITDTGFELSEIDLLLPDVNETHVESNRAPLAVPGATAVSTLGDLWVLGDHRLLCADVSESASFERLLVGQQADMLFTEPPCDFSVHSPVRVDLGQRHDDAAGEMTTEFVGSLKHLLGLSAAYSVNGAVHFVCMDRHHSRELHAAGHDVYGELLDVCVWVNAIGGVDSLYRAEHKFVFVFKAGSAPHINNIALDQNGPKRTNVWSYAENNRFAANSYAVGAHGNVKPGGR
jgi:ParB-like nuclease domain